MSQLPGVPTIDAGNVLRGTSSLGQQGMAGVPQANIMLQQQALGLERSRFGLEQQRAWNEMDLSRFIAQLNSDVSRGHLGIEQANARLQAQLHQAYMQLTGQQVEQAKIATGQARAMAPLALRQAKAATSVAEHQAEVAPEMTRQQLKAMSMQNAMQEFQQTLMMRMPRLTQQMALIQALPQLMGHLGGEYSQELQYRMAPATAKLLYSIRDSRTQYAAMRRGIDGLFMSGSLTAKALQSANEEVSKRDYGAEADRMIAAMPGGKEAATPETRMQLMETLRSRDMNAAYERAVLPMLAGEGSRAAQAFAKADPAAPAPLRAYQALSEVGAPFGLQKALAAAVALQAYTNLPGSESERQAQAAQVLQAGGFDINNQPFNQARDYLANMNPASQQALMHLLYRAEGVAQTAKGPQDAHKVIVAGLRGYLMSDAFSRTGPSPQDAGAKDVGGGASKLPSPFVRADAMRDPSQDTATYSELFGQLFSTTREGMPSYQQLKAMSGQAIALEYRYLKTLEANGNNPDAPAVQEAIKAINQFHADATTFGQGMYKARTMTPPIQPAAPALTPGPSYPAQVKAPPVPSPSIAPFSKPEPMPTADEARMALEDLNKGPQPGSMGGGATKATMIPESVVDAELGTGAYKGINNGIQTLFEASPLPAAVKALRGRQGVEE